MRERGRLWPLILFAVFSLHPATAQDEQTGSAHSPHTAGGMSMADMNPASMYLMNLASGTSQNPPGSPMPMVMTHVGNWNKMFMGLGFLSDIQQSGPRGAR